MRSLNLTLKVYIGLVAALGAGVLTLGFLRQPVVAGVQAPALAAALAVLTGLAGAYPIPLGPKVKVSLATAPTFVAVLLLPPALAATAAGLGMAISQVILKWRWPHILLNSAMTVLCVGGAGLAYAAVNHTGALFFSWPMGLAGTAVAAATIYLLNRVVVAGAASIQTGKNQFRLWQREWKQDAIQDLALFSLGFAGALAYHLAPWALAFLALAVVIAHKAFARVMAPGAKPKAAIAEPGGTQTPLAQTPKRAALARQ